MKKVLIGFVSALLLSAPTMGKAETLMVEYYSLLGPADAYNSRGQPLNDLCAIVQQDRANWHRFYNREEFDSGDSFFDSTNRRSMIAGKCVYDRNYYANPGTRIRNGTRSFYVYVQVFGSNGQISRVLITEGAG
jgi:hypothetical protein